MSNDLSNAKIQAIAVASCDRWHCDEKRTVWDNLWISIFPFSHFSSLRRSSLNGIKQKFNSCRVHSLQIFAQLWSLLLLHLHFLLFFVIVAIGYVRRIKIELKQVWGDSGTLRERERSTTPFINYSICEFRRLHNKFFGSSSQFTGQRRHAIRAKILERAAKEKESS